MTQENSVSLCMIVCNEEKRLEKCLNSVEKFVDEIIIVDTGSTDSTIQIAGKYTKHIYSYDWKQDFSEARNFSINKATSDYILILDADEYLDDGLSLKNAIQADIDCYACKIRNFQSNGGAFYHLAYRLFRNGIGLIYKNQLHEQLNTEELPFIKISNSPIVINHDGYTQEVQLEKNKNKRNLEILKQEIDKNPSAYSLYNIGREYYIAGEYNSALESFKQSYSMKSNAIYIPDLLNKMGRSLLHLKRFEEGLTLIIDSVKLFPNEVELWFTVGLLYKEMKHYYDALQSFQTCLKLGDQGYQVTEGTGSYIALLVMSEVEYDKGNTFKAFEFCVDSLKIEKNYIPTMLHFFKIIQKEKLPNKEVIETFKTIYPIKAIDDIKNILEVLYHSRSPLLLYFIEDYKVNVQKKVMAVANLYNKKYIQSYKLFKDEARIESENKHDIIALSYLLGNEDFIDDLLDINISKKERKILKQIINKTGLKKSEYSDEFLDIILQLALTLLQLKSIKAFEDVISRCLFTHQQKFELVRRLIEEHEFDYVEELIKENIGSKKNKWLKLLADFFIKTKNVDNAIITLTELIKFDKSYFLYESLYDCYHQKGDVENMQRVTKEISQRFPFCQWIKENK